MLEGIRVLELCDERGHLAGKILGDLGADVVKLEPPGGDPLRARGPFASDAAGREHGLAWAALNTSKRSVVLDPESADGRAALAVWLAEADVLLETLTPDARAALGLGASAVMRAWPRLVHCAITPFGADGPRAALAGHDLAVVAMGGNAAMTGPPEGPPLRCSLPTSHFHGGPEAVLGVLTALIERERSGLGQFVDVSLQECQVGTLLSGPGQRALGAPRGRRTGARLGRTREIWAAADGWISFGLRGGPARIPNLVATVALMSECGMAPDWLRAFDWKTWNPATVDDETLERVESAFAAFFRSRPMRELYEQALERRILLAPCNDPAEILGHAQLRSRSLFAPVEGPPGAPPLELPAFFARWHGPGDVRVRSRAPHLDEHAGEGWREPAWPRDPLPSQQDAGAPVFAGLRILELGSGAAGPVASRYFAEYGADVIRLESRRRPDFLRFLQPDGAEGLDRAPMFALLNPDKRSVGLDMTRPEAREVFERLVDWADVVAENFAPGVLERWGIDVEAVCARRPDLVFVRGCLFGQTGPQRQYPGFGGQGSAIAGFNHLTGMEDGEAVGPYATITDSLSPRYLAAALAAALLQRGRSGEGGQLDVSQIEAGVYSLSEMIARESAGAPGARRRGNRSEHAAPHGIYPCAGSDRWLAVAVLDDDAWEALVAECERDGRPRPPGCDRAAGRLERQDAIDAWLAGWTAGHEPGTLMARLQAAGVEAAAVQDFDDLLADPQLRHRRHFVPVPHTELGTLQVERSGFRLSRAEGGFERAGPRLGEHTREVLEHVLGLAPHEVDRLAADGIIDGADGIID